MRFRPPYRLLLGLIAAALFPACASTDSQAPTQITNSKYYNLDPDALIATPDPMLSFEQRRYFHGAITREERKAREGHYYVFWWEDAERSPAVVRLEYRQENSGSLVKVKEQAIDDVGRKNKTYFEVIGEEYDLGGKVSAWRVSIVRGGQVVATDQSYLW